MTRRSAREQQHANDVELITGWLKDLPDLLATVGKVITLDEAHPSTLDGYPASASGAASNGGGRRTVLVGEDEHGPEELVEVTGVEGTAFALLEPALARRRDVVRNIARDMSHHRRELTDSLSMLRRDVERFHNLRGTADDPTDDCLSCVRAEVVSPRSDRYADLCRWCGDYKGANGQLPPVGVIKDRARGVRITSKVLDHHTVQLKG